MLRVAKAKADAEAKAKADAEAVAKTDAEYRRVAVINTDKYNQDIAAKKAEAATKTLRQAMEDRDRHMLPFYINNAKKARIVKQAVIEEAIKLQADLEAMAKKETTARRNALRSTTNSKASMRRSQDQKSQQKNISKQNSIDTTSATSSTSGDESILSPRRSTQRQLTPKQQQQLQTSNRLSTMNTRRGVRGGGSKIKKMNDQKTKKKYKRIIRKRNVTKRKRRV